MQDAEHILFAVRLSRRVSSATHRTPCRRIRYSFVYLCLFHGATHAEDGVNDTRCIPHAHSVVSAYTSVPCTSVHVCIDTEFIVLIKSDAEVAAIVATMAH